MNMMKTQDCLRTFLKVSQIQIDNRENVIRKQNLIKKDDSNIKFMRLVEEKNKIQGNLDCVRLEILDILLDDPSLISDTFLVKKGYESISDFVKNEKEKIELRGLYKEYPFSIEKILEIALESEEDIYKPVVTKGDVLSSVNIKNVKTMIKFL